MATHYLHAYSTSELESVELAWDKLFQYDRGHADVQLLEAVAPFLSSTSTSWVFIGRHDVAKYVADVAGSALAIEYVTVESTDSLSERQIDDLASRTLARSHEDAAVLLCVTDRYDAHRLRLRLPDIAPVYTLDVLKDVLGERLPEPAWRKKFTHIYPIDVPGIDIEPNLDVLLLDVPARSLAQLPIGFAYVYKAIRQTSVRLQALDVDLIAYHRYHSRRCLNYLDHIERDEIVHPRDPWQAENYIVWTDRKFLAYFHDILDELVAKIIQARPRIIGLSLHQTSHTSVSYVVERVKQALPDVVVIVGGMSCYQHFVARRIFPDADYVVVGEADTVIAPLVEALVRGERPVDVPGAVSPLDSENRTFIGAPLPHNLDVIGPPDYGFTDLDLYVNWDGYRLMPLVGSRGCGWSRCTFCAERFNWRARTPEKVAEEIEYYTTRGFKDFVFNESDFNSNLSFVVRLCNEIVRRGIKANFTSQLRIGKDCDFEYYKAMKAAGFSCLRFGVDALSENTLKLQRKGYTKQMVLDNLRHCHTLGIFTEINVVIGVPGETEADIEESADFIIEMKPYIGRVAFINPLMLFVGSVYYFEPDRHNIKFNGDKDELYSQYFVSLPDSAWYSTEPYIDHHIRTQRFFRIVERIHAEGVPLGAFANFTAEFRKKRREDSHTLTQPKPVERHTDDRPAEPEVSAAAWLAEAVPAPTPEEDKTEFQKTFYGSWSSAFLSGIVGDRGPSSTLLRRIVKIEDEFFIATNTVVDTREITKFYPAPQLLREYKGFNLVGYQKEIFGAPLALGPLDLTRKDTRKDRRIVRGQTEAEVVRTIDFVDAATGMSHQIASGAPPASGAASRDEASRSVRRRYDTPTLVGSYKGYNLVGFGHEILAAPLHLGRVDLSKSAARSDPRILKGPSALTVVAQIDGGTVKQVERDHRAPGDDRHDSLSTNPVIPMDSLRKVNMGAGVLLRWGK
jgi:radical SAM superfamily enzyme YgiQ (UPF0313 family)